MSPHTNKKKINYFYYVFFQIQAKIKGAREDNILTLSSDVSVFDLSPGCYLFNPLSPSTPLSLTSDSFI